MVSTLPVSVLVTQLSFTVNDIAESDSFMSRPLVAFKGIIRLGSTLLDWDHKNQV